MVFHQDYLTDIMCLELINIAGYELRTEEFDDGEELYFLLGESELNDSQAHLSFKWLNLCYYQPRFQGFRRYPKNMSQSARYIMDEWNAWSIENTENQKVFG